MSLSVSEPDHTQFTIPPVSYMAGLENKVSALWLYCHTWEIHTTGAIVVEEGMKLIRKSSQQVSPYNSV